MNRKQIWLVCAELFPVDPILRIIEANCGQIGKVAFLTGLHGVNILGAFSVIWSLIFKVSLGIHFPVHLLGKRSVCLDSFLEEIRVH